MNADGTPIARRRAITAAGTVLFAGLAGCLGDDDDADDHSIVAEAPFDEVGVGEFELLDRAHDPPEMVAYVHGDHWHGGLPTVPLGGTLSLGAEVVGDTGDPIDLSDEYELRAGVAHGAPEGVVDFDFHGDHVHVVGETEGVTEIVLVLWHDDHADYQSPAITVQVTGVDDADAFDAHHVDELHILDRAHDPHEAVAEWHDDHWHGALPTVPVGDTVSLGAVFIDEDGNEAALSDEYELRVALADGAAELVSFDFHGDHVHVIGEAEGTTQVVFQLWHDDHAEFTSTPIDVTVGAAS